MLGRLLQKRTLIIEKCSFWCVNFIEKCIFAARLCSNMLIMRIKQVNINLSDKESYSKVPKGCKSLEEFGDKLKEAILKKKEIRFYFHHFVFMTE